MLTEARISKKTFFAAAALAIVAALPAQAYLFEDDSLNWQQNFNGYEFVQGKELFRVDSAFAQSLSSFQLSLANQGNWSTFVKTGTGVLEAHLGATGFSLFNLHQMGYTNNNQADDGAHYFQVRTNGIAANPQGLTLGVAQSANILQGWNRGGGGGGEIVVDNGRLNLTGYVNTWYDFGSILNVATIGSTKGTMVGASRITVRNGAVLDLSGNNNFTDGAMVATGSRTTLQFLRNLQAGDLGTDLNSNLALGTSTAFHLNLHTESWSENTRIDTGITPDGQIINAHADSALAFGGSIGKISGAGNIYKTGEGAFTILSASMGYFGSLYAAGGELVLAETDSVGSTESFVDGFGNEVRVKVSNGLGNAASINIAGTFNSGKEANGGSMQGKAIGRNEHYNIVVVPTQDPNIENVYTSIKESFFTPPSAGTLIIAENQTINNFQALFNAGFSVASGTSSGEAVLAAANNNGVLSRYSETVSVGTSDAPVIAGTGAGSSLVIPGGNYTLSPTGEYTINLDKDGYMQGGVLVINQSSGMGGIYEGSIVGARVSIYDKTQFDLNTKANVTEGIADFGNATRLSDVLQRENDIKAALKQIYTDKTDTEINALYAQLGVDRAGSFALDNKVAWDVVNYYKAPQAVGGSPHQFYIDYQANESVKGGVLVLKGAGDLALLLDSANYSGIYIDKNRTGKTVLNIAAINALEGTTVSLGGRGTVAFVANHGDTLRVKVDGFGRGTRLVFTTAELLNTISGQIKVGGSRKASIGFSQVQDKIYGDVYVERGIELNFNGAESVFKNAGSITLWAGSTIVDDTIPAPSLNISSAGSTAANQFVNNLTGDDKAKVTITNGALTTSMTTNALDGYSGLVRGVYNGQLAGAGSLIKDGTATLTLGGGELNRAFTGTMEVAKGTLVISRANGLTGAGALILNSNTTASMTGDQSIRTLYGDSTTSVTVTGTLSLGANFVPANGENRPSVGNNLGTSLSNFGNVDFSSFARFLNCYDLEGNLILSQNQLPNQTVQNAATVDYLTATAKLAYSGFDATTLKKFVGVKAYDGSELLSQSEYDALLKFAENGGRGVAPSGVSQGSLLADLAKMYDDLAQETVYLQAFKKTAAGDGWWSPAGLESLFSSKGEYLSYVNNTLKSEVETEYGASLPATPTSAEKEAINNALFEVLCQKYEALSAENLKKQVAANPESMFASFKTAKNLAGTALLSESDIAALDLFIQTNKGNANALITEYNRLKGLTDLIENKKQFAGITVPGAFANQVNASGSLIDTSWITSPSFSGTLRAPVFVKTGDSALHLTGKLESSKVVIESGRLNVESSTLVGTTEGISISRDANLSVNVVEDIDIKFGYAISGNGNFIKTGAGKLTLDSTAEYTGTTMIEGGTLQMTLRNPITTTTNGVTTTLPPQNNIFLAANNVSLVLDQKDDVVWAGSILALNNRVENSRFEKTGEGQLTIRGEVQLLRSSQLVVSEGELNLQGLFTYTGGDNVIAISEGAALSLNNALGANPGDEVRFSGYGALRITGAVDLAGNTEPIENPIPANGQGMKYDAFFGTVNIGGTGSLTLSENSVFSKARNVHVARGGSLTVNDSQTLRSLSGTGTVTIGNNDTLQMDQRGARIVAGYSSGDYTFNEEVLLDAPDFAGTLSGDGSVAIIGAGVSSFSGTVVDTKILVQGGQVVLSAENFGGTVSVNGATKIYTDKNGNKINGYSASASSSGAANVSSGIVSSVDGYLPRTIITTTGSEIDVSGKTITYENGNLVFTDDAGKEHVIASVKEWDFSVNNTLSANWGVVDAKGDIIEDLSSALEWDTGSQKYVLAAGYSATYKWLAEDANGNLIVADTSVVSELSSEVCFLVKTGTQSLGTSTISFTGSDGAFGKVGGGQLNVQSTDFANCGKITVYDGTLDINGWVEATKIIASGATLSMTVASNESPNFTTVIGSGTFELTAAGDISISSTNGNSLPVFADDGKFFNGRISFKNNGASNYSVTLSGAPDNMLDMASISTEAGVSLSVSNVKFNQSQNSNIDGYLSITGAVSVEGSKESSGRVLSKDIRRLTVREFAVGGAAGAFALKNVGFGFNSTQSNVRVDIDKDSLANAFFVTLDTDETTLVNTDTVIGLNVSPVSGDSGKLKELSFVKSGTGNLTLTADAIAALGQGTAGANDTIFGLEKEVYETLEKNDGVFNIGVESGTLTLTSLAASGTFETATGTNVDLVTLRSSVAATAGTLKIATTDAHVLAETIKGSGNVNFAGTSQLVVTAAQAYTGETIVSGDVHFSGEGQYNKSSQITVENGGTLSGGIHLVGREVNYAIIKARNADDTGVAGSTTLTLTLDDERLPAEIKCQVEISSAGILDPNSLVTLGGLPEGVSVENASYEKGKLVLTLKDNAFGGAAYDVSINVDSKTFPKTAGSSGTEMGTATVAGNVTLESGGQIVLDAAAGDYISVGAGTVTLNSSGIMIVENLNAETRGKTLALISAGTVTDGGTNIGADAVVAALRNAGDPTMKLMVFTDPITGIISARMITDNFATAGSNYNKGISGSFLNALSSIASWNGSSIVNADNLAETDGKKLFFALNALTTAELSKEVDKLSPNSFASMLAMPVAAFNSDIARIHSRLDQRRYDGANPLRESGEYEFFALAQSDFAESGNGNNSAIFDYNLHGVTAGFDWKPNYETTFGFALGYTYGKAKVHDGGGKINMDDMRVTAFASRLFGNFYLDAGIQAGMATFDTRRNTVAGRASGETDSVFAGTFVTLGSVFSIYQDKKDGSGLYFTPSIGLSYLHTSIEDFRENGVAGLEMDKSDGDSLRARVAAGLQWAFPFADWEMRLGVEIAYTHDFLGEELDMDGRFAAGGPRFSTSGKALPTDIFSFGPTVDVMISERSSLYFGYGIDVDTDSGISQNVNAGFRHRF